MRKHLLSVLLIALLLGSGTVLFANGLNLNGIGSKATSMGGAFVGLADDYSAVFWNPAGLTQMESSTFSVYGTFIIPKGTYKLEFGGVTLVDTQMESKIYPSGAIGYFKPLSDKLVVGILAYVPSGSGSQWNGEDLAPVASGIYEWESKVGLFTISPVVAYKFSDTLSIGATFNINYGILNMKRPVIGQFEEDDSGMGFNSTLGILFKPTETLSVGLSFKTPMKVKLKGTSKMPGAALLGLAMESEVTREVTWPMWFGAGVAFKPMENLTITADIQYTNWKKLDTIPADYENAGWKAFIEPVAAFTLNWEDKIQYRFGLEYKINEMLALRGGYYYDPAPAPVNTMTILLPSLTYNVITFGIGYTNGGLTLDFGLEYLKGSDRELSAADALPGVGMPGIYGMNILVPNLAVSFNF